MIKGSDEEVIGITELLLSSSQRGKLWGIKNAVGQYLERGATAYYQKWTDGIGKARIYHSKQGALGAITSISTSGTNKSKEIPVLVEFLLLEQTAVDQKTRVSGILAARERRKLTYAQRMTDAKLKIAQAALEKAQAEVKRLNGGV